MRRRHPTIGSMVENCGIAIEIAMIDARDEFRRTRPAFIPVVGCINPSAAHQTLDMSKV